MLRYLLGIKVMRNKHEIVLFQRKYMLDLLFEIGKLGVKPCNFPMASGINLTIESKTFEDPEIYRRLVAKLNYLSITCLDIAYSVNVVSQYIFASTVDRWTVVEQILCYLKGASGRDILDSNHVHNIIECFFDTDWARSKEDRKSTSRYYVFVGGNLVLWKSKKQSVVFRSSIEFEYKAIAQSMCEIMWLHQL